MKKKKKSDVKTGVCAEAGRRRERREESSLVKHGAVYSSRSTVTEAHFRKHRDFRPSSFCQKSLTELNQVVLRLRFSAFTMIQNAIFQHV